MLSSCETKIWSRNCISKVTLHVLIAYIFKCFCNLPLSVKIFLIPIICMALYFCSSGEHIRVWTGSLFVLSHWDHHLGPVNVTLPRCSILSLSAHPALIYPRKTSIISAASTLSSSSSVLL